MLISGEGCVLEEQLKINQWGEGGWGWRVTINGGGTNEDVSNNMVVEEVDKLKDM